MKIIAEKNGKHLRVGSNLQLHQAMITTPTSKPLDYRHRREDCLKFCLLWQTEIADNSVQILESIKREPRSNNKLVQIKRRENCKTTSRH